ncbi:MAG: tetratricopeptide repeat protein [Proteobacteria bacterium]|nr:tetratricopeptide repeat protein [Pseudomonadota bacterium]
MGDKLAAMTSATASKLSDRDVQNLLKQALDAMNKNDFGQAEMALMRVLEERPAEPDALQLMGLIRRGQGRTLEAEELYRRSLAANPNQPHVHHNLGNVLALSGRVDAANAAQREAIRLKPNFVEALLQLGQGLHSKGDFAGAEKTYRTALKIQPNWASAKQVLAATLNEVGKAKEGETLLHQALASTRDPQQAAALQHDIGLSLKFQSRHAEALEWINRAKSVLPNHAIVEYNRGNVLQLLNRNEEAIAAYRNAIAKDPINMLAHRDLNHLLYRLKRDDEFLRSFDDAAVLYPDFGPLPLNRANFLFRSERYEEAQDYYAAAARLMPENVTARIGLAMSRARLGDAQSAIPEHETALRYEPENAHAWSNFAETLIRAGDYKRAEEAAARAIAIEPNDQGALGMWSLALRLLGDGREDYLNDYEKFVQLFELGVPEGFSSVEEFNHELNRYLDAMHQDRREHVDQTLRGGTQTLENLFGNKEFPIIELLRQRVDEAVLTYIQRMKDDPEHPLLKRKRAGFEYSGSWSSRLRDCGFHTNHVHPKGWISSAYYIAVPESVSDTKQKQGWIKFGEPHFDLGLKDPIRRTIQPKPGTLVLFPSYMWHGTVPFHSAQDRTTIAFDAVPK